jgi:hypothetical protein
MKVKAIMQKAGKHHPMGIHSVILNLVQNLLRGSPDPEINSG